LALGLDLGFACSCDLSEALLCLPEATARASTKAAGAWAINGASSSGTDGTDCTAAGPTLEEAADASATEGLIFSGARYSC